MTRSSISLAAPGARQLFCSAAEAVARKSCPHTICFPTWDCEAHECSAEGKRMYSQLGQTCTHSRTKGQTPNSCSGQAGAGAGSAPGTAQCASSIPQMLYSLHIPGLCILERQLPCDSRRCPRRVVRRNGHQERELS